MSEWKNQHENLNLSEVSVVCFGIAIMMICCYLSFFCINCSGCDCGREYENFKISNTRPNLFATEDNIHSTSMVQSVAT